MADTEAEAKAKAERDAERQSEGRPTPVQPATTRGSGRNQVDEEREQLRRDRVHNEIVPAEVRDRTQEMAELRETVAKGKRYTGPYHLIDGEPTPGGVVCSGLPDQFQTMCATHACECGHRFPLDHTDVCWCCQEKARLGGQRVILARAP